MANPGVELAGLENWILYTILTAGIPAKQLTGLTGLTGLSGHRLYKRAEALKSHGV